jgi:streptomycin 3"-adenylyltransferase
MDFQPILNKISARYQNILRTNLTGLYIHGSVAFGCFNWDKSDIDFIAVAENPLSYDVKLALLRALEELSEYAPPKGLEMSVVLKAHCQRFLYPTPYELHFSNAWRLARHLDNPARLREPTTDCDLAAHFMVTKKVGQVLWGEPIERVFGDVPAADYWDSIYLDVKNAKDDVLSNPMYVILNLCRVLAYASEKAVLSKEQGGQWGLNRLPCTYHNLIADMLNHYRSGTVITSGKDIWLDFCDFALTEIDKTMEILHK